MAKRYALISTADKTGIVPLAKDLVTAGFTIISTGGTAKKLKEAGVKVIKVSAVTKYPEIFGGRVKSLHPLIHGGILRDRSKEDQTKTAKELKIPNIDVVVVNLYPFEETIAKEGVTESEAIEQIDIGGPTLLRAAAKNFRYVTVLNDSADYKEAGKQLIKKGETTVEFRKKMAQKVFEHTSHYDTMIANYMRGEEGEPLNLHYVKERSLRYGENPHQKAAFFRNPKNSDANVTNAKVIQGKQLSFNNIVDANGAIELVRDFKEPTAAFIKHTNPCGIASSDTIEKAFDIGYNVDPLSAFGCVIALNRKCTEEIVEYIIKNKLFVEILAAPAFTKGALKLLEKRKNLRVLEIGKLTRLKNQRDIKKVAGGILVQTADDYVVSKKDLKTVSKKKATDAQLEAMLFARNVVKHVKSNAVVFAKKTKKGIVATGIGAGQMSRVDSVFIARNKGGDNIPGSVMASDAFFPFPDGVIEAHKAGVVGIIQPGGSIRDDEVIKKVDELGMSMIFTGIRSFKH